MMSPHKKLIYESEQYLLLVNTKEYIEFQHKFDKLHSQIKREQQVLIQILKEFKVNRNNFIEKQEIENDTSNPKNDLVIKMDKSEALEKNINNMTKEIQNLNSTLDDYNFISRF
ncbi:MAG: hypothetical protein DRG78_16840 [Epsilonproteobacteria bacterium]|nr:MAG: hypothetical protein DRG78_16840 [Campylobacterota bacterium]